MVLQAMCRRNVTRRKQEVKRTLSRKPAAVVPIRLPAVHHQPHFHHVDPTAKSFALSMNTTKALATYREEMRKCVLLCRNCHGEVEAGLDAESAGRSEVQRLR